MNTNTPLVAVWTDRHTSHERILVSLQEALDLMNEMGKLPPSSPAMVEFFEPDSGLALAIGVGRAETVATFQYSLDPPYYMSRGRPAAQGVITFYYGNEETEYPAKNAVPFAAGREALEYFVLNRTRPPNLDWEQL